MRSSKIHKSNMRHYVDSMNRIDKESCGPLVKCMEEITGVNHTGMKRSEPVANTVEEVMETNIMTNVRKL